MGGVFDHPQLMARRERPHAIEVEHQPADVHGDHPHHFNRRYPAELAAGRPFELCLRVGDIEVQGFRVAVHQDRDGIEVSDDLGRGRERHGGNKDGSGRVAITANAQGSSAR